MLHLVGGREILPWCRGEAEYCISQAPHDIVVVCDAFVFAVVQLLTLQSHHSQYDDK